MEEEEWDESNSSEFTRLVEQREQTWKPAAEELETINVGSDQLKKELKIGTLITSEQRTKMIALLQNIQMSLLGPMKICPVWIQIL